MSNNAKLISSISLESDFEKLIKLYAQELFDGKAYLIGGPWDNGKDLVIKKTRERFVELLKYQYKKMALRKK